MLASECFMKIDYNLLYLFCYLSFYSIFVFFVALALLCLPYCASQYANNLWSAHVRKRIIIFWGVIKYTSGNGNSEEGKTPCAKGSYNV